jgi:hypothetical protein
MDNLYYVFLIAFEITRPVISLPSRLFAQCCLINVLAGEKPKATLAILCRNYLLSHKQNVTKADRIHHLYFKDNDSFFPPA